MTTITLLTDYKGYFESKHKTPVYRSGFETEKLESALTEMNYQVQTLPFTEIDFLNNDYSNQLFLYTSSEDPGYYYKSYIEDVILALAQTGAIVIPAYNFLRANNNKVFMEFLRQNTKNEGINSLRSRHYGTIEEFNKHNHEFPKVVKESVGAISAGVRLARNKKHAQKQIKKLIYVPQFKYYVYDWLRKFKHKNYIPDSKYRKKFIVQDFVPGLKNDWKIYFFGEKLYIWYRFTRDNDFRASGSGKFLFNEEVPVPHGLFDFAQEVYKQFDIPFISIDIGWDGKVFYLFEMQFVYFGKNGHFHSTHYYEKEYNTWVKKENTNEIETVYAESIHGFISNKYKNVYV